MTFYSLVKRLKNILAKTWINNKYVLGFLAFFESLELSSLSSFEVQLDILCLINTSNWWKISPHLPHSKLSIIYEERVSTSSTFWFQKLKNIVIYIILPIIFDILSILVLLFLLKRFFFTVEASCSTLEIHYTCKPYIIN